MEQTTRILWLSDIHYRPDFELPEMLEKRNKKFHEKVAAYLEEIKNEDVEDNKLHYFIISGDLGFSGKATDYKKLKDEIISELEEIFKRKGQNPIILCCPGNHDVNRERPAMYEKFIKLLQTYIEDDELSTINIAQQDVAENKRKANAAQRENLLIKYGIHEAQKVFTNYTNFVKTLIPKIGKRKNVILNSYLEGNYLFGQVLDHKQKIVYTILNSAWFSLGDGFDELIVKYYEKKLNAEIFKILKKNKNVPKSKIFETRKEYLLRITKVKEMCSEFGKQIVSQKIIKDGEFITTLKAYPHYTAITLFHHPLSWLEESQKYDYEKNGETELIQLLKFSDILLTGHEHVNTHITPEKLYDRLIHIPGGMFIQDNNQYYKGGENRFAFLEIDNKNKNLSVRNFIWDKKSEEWTKYIEEGKKWEKIDFGEKLSYFITRHSKKSYTDDFREKFKPLLYLKKYVDPEIDKVSQTVQNWSSEFEVVENNKTSEIYKFKKYSKNKRSYLIIVLYISGDSLFSKPENFEKIKDLIDSFIYVNKKKERHIILMQLDLITTQAPEEKGLETAYFSFPQANIFVIDKVIRENFDRIQKKADIRFNLFRNMIFLKKEASENDENQQNRSARFSNYIDVRFGNFVIPFWTIGDYI